MKIATTAEPRGLTREAGEDSTAKLRGALTWYFSQVYGRTEGPGTVPFYCDPKRVGHFAVCPSELAAGRPNALFKLFVTMAMFQARRDVVIMRQQASMLSSEAQALTSTSALAQRAVSTHCDQLASAEIFDAGCSVHKRGATVDCTRRPRAHCHVKEATVLMKRMGDMGKLPTSAWLHVWKGESLASLLNEVHTGEADPQQRAAQLVENFSRIYRVGEKLATMFVSAVSTPALAPGLTPWFPSVDGNSLVIVDTNVARAVDQLRSAGATQTYASRANWIRERARSIDLRDFGTDLPRFSPRIVQQALYSFCSRSNRTAQSIDCSMGTGLCALCVPVLCPFGSPRP